MKKAGPEKQPLPVTSFSEISISSQCDFRDQEGMRRKIARTEHS
jgi:hypothetical protein